MLIDRPKATSSGSQLNGDVHQAPLRSPTHASTTIEYTSSAPLPPSSSAHAQNGEEDEDIPTHLYDRLPSHMLEDGKPDYLRMILMCASSRLVCTLHSHSPADVVAKVYTAPLNLKETPLTLAVNLSARLGNEVRWDQPTHRRLLTVRFGLNGRTCTQSSPSRSEERTT